jgi:hypothetical protein
MRNIFSCCLLALFSAPVWASRPIDLGREVRDAASVIVGHAEARESFIAADGEIYTRVTLRVDAALKGAPGAGSLVLTIPGGEVGDLGLIDSTAPELGQGEPVLVLLDNQEGEQEEGKWKATRGISLGGGTVAELAQEPKLVLGIVAEELGREGLRISPQEFKKASESIDRYAAATPLAATVACFKLIGPKWANKTASFRLNSTLPSTFPDAMRRAAASWSNSGSQFKFSEDPMSNNVVSLAPISTANVLAQTRISYSPSTNTLISFTLTFNSSFQWTNTGTPGTFDIEGVGAHELGHAVGLDHPADASCAEQTMWFSSSSGETKKRSLESGDKEGTVSLYAAGGTVTPPPPTPTISTPVLNTLYTYPRPTANRTFLLAALGSAFDTALIEFVVKGGSCPAAGCIIARAQLSNVSSTQAIANFFTSVRGQYTLQLRNGLAGPVSAAVAAFTVR